MIFAPSEAQGLLLLAPSETQELLLLETRCVVVVFTLSERSLAFIGALRYCTGRLDAPAYADGDDDPYCEDSVKYHEKGPPALVFVILSFCFDK